MRKYTEKIHAQRVQKMMESKDPCECCPAAPYFDGNLNPWRMWSGAVEYSPCNICKEFVDMDTRSRCPCIGLGKQKAIKYTWIALEEKGYLK